MAEYIEREAALSAQNKSMNLSECRKRLERIPAADVRPAVRGKWIDEHPDEMNDPRMRCSVCTCVEAPLLRWRFCPNCGADMRETNDEKA